MPLARPCTVFLKKHVAEPVDISKSQPMQSSTTSAAAKRRAPRQARFISKSRSMIPITSAPVCFAATQHTESNAASSSTRASPLSIQRA